MKARTALALSFLILHSVGCASVPNRESQKLLVRFHDYRCDSVHMYLADEGGNEFEEIYDSVVMTVLSDGAFKGRCYEVWLGESPVRNEFLQTGECRIEIDGLSDDDSNPDSMVSSSIRFFDPTTGGYR